LVFVTLLAGLVLARHGQAASGLEDIRSMRIMALHAIHPAFQDGVMVG
jgi:hypothetical protein